MAWDEWQDWFERRKRRFPFFGDWYFEGLEETMREMEHMMEEMFKKFTEQIPKELIRERKLQDGRIVREAGPIIWGYSMTVGLDGKPVIREFGNLSPAARRKPWEPPFSFKEEREPLVDIVETDSEVKVLAELPGVEKDEIKLHLTQNTLTINVDTDERKYHKKLELPAEVDLKSARSTYRNGVLEVTFRKIEKRKPTGVPINIE